MSQASVLSLYDPDRLAHPMYAKDGAEGVEATWDDFALWWKRNAATLDAKGKGIAVCLTRAGGPTREAQVAKLRAQWPDADVIGYDAMENENAIEGSRIAFGAPMREMLAIEKARVIVSLDRDFLQFEAGALPNSRGWGRVAAGVHDQGRHEPPVLRGVGVLDHGRRGGSPPGAGALADSELRGALAKIILSKRATPGNKALADAMGSVTPSTTGIDQRFLESMANDLVDMENAGKTLVVCGRSQPAHVHALVAAINAALECVGKTVSYVPASAEEGVSSLGAHLRAGRQDAQGRDSAPRSSWGAIRSSTRRPTAISRARSPK